MEKIGYYGVHQLFGYPNYSKYLLLYSAEIHTGVKQLEGE